MLPLDVSVGRMEIQYKLNGATYQMTGEQEYNSVAVVN